MMSRRFLIAAMAALPLPLAALGVPCAARAQAEGPAAPISLLNQALIQVMRAGSAGTPFPQRYNALAPVIDQVFDLQTILQTSVGLRWEQLPAEQQAELAQVFRAFTICSWAANFDSYDGQQFEILPEQRSVGADQVVATRLVRGSKFTRLDYLMRQGPAGWKAVDVLLDGSISRVAVQRSDFRSLMSSGNAEPLIRSLQQKVAQLSGGTVSS